MLVVDIVVDVCMVLLVLLLLLVTVAGKVVVELELVGDYCLQGWYLLWEKLLACSHGWCFDRVQESWVVQNVLEEFSEQSGATIHPSFQL